MADTVVNSSDSGLSGATHSNDVVMAGSEDSTKTNLSDKAKREFTEEEKLRRKEYFKAWKIAKAKKRKNMINKVAPSRNILNRKMTNEDKKMLEFYQVRLSTLRSENELLHKRLDFLVKENMRLLQMGPA